MERPERRRLQQVSRLLQALLLRQAGVMSPRQHQVQIEAWLRLYGQRRMQQGHREQGIEGRRRRQSIACERNVRPHHVVELHAVNARDRNCCSKLGCGCCRWHDGRNRIPSLHGMTAVFANSSVSALLAVPVLRLPVLASAVRCQALPALPLLLAVLANAAA
jgi:hypothetical protein